MTESIYRILERVLSRLKGRDYPLDRGIPLGLLAGISVRRLAWLLRGLLKTTVLQRRPSAVFIAPQVNLRNASMVRFGRGVTLERGVILDGLSRNGIEIGAHTLIGPYAVLRCSVLTNLGAGIKFGANCSVDAYSYIGAAGPITIGNNVIMGQHVCFHAENHNFDRVDIPIKQQGVTRKGIVIEDDVWVGANTTFLDGAHVGRGCVVGAGSIVRGEVPPYSIIAGVPARVLRSRLPQASITVAGES